MRDPSVELCHPAHRVAERDIGVAANPRSKDAAMNIPQVPGFSARRNALLTSLGCALALTVLAAVGAAASGKPGGGGGGGGGGKADKSPPSITVTGMQQTSTSVTITGTASDNVGVTAVSVSVDGGTYAAAQGTTSWSYTVSTSGLAAGSHTAAARATDAAGNISTARVSFSVSAPAPTDTSPPTATIAVPTANTTVSGTAIVSGTAADNTSVASVAVSIDGGAYQSAQGTTIWSASVNTSTLGNGPHTVTARATDGSGNVGSTSETVDVMNDVAPPTVTVTAPLSGATVSGTVTVTGTASDDVSVASVAVSVDGAAYAAATGTSSWSYSLDTTKLTNGSHTLAARATDTSGKTTTASVTLNVSNSAPAGYSEKLVTPEGATILIASNVTNFTAQQIYDLLKPNAYQLGLIGPHLTVRVQTTYNTFTTTSAGTSGGVYTSYSASMYLDASSNSLLLTRPDATIAHEYGAVWSMYHLYLTEQGNWNPWLQARGLLGNPLLDSSDVWSRGEMIADDYRMLFGTQAAQDQMGYVNTEVPDPRTVPGLKDFFVSTWGA
jgi:Bacterial Ig domain